MSDPDALDHKSDRQLLLTEIAKTRAIQDTLAKLYELVERQQRPVFPIFNIYFSPPKG